MLRVILSLVLMCTAINGEETSQLSEILTSDLEQLEDLLSVNNEFDDEMAARNASSALDVHSGLPPKKPLLGDRKLACVGITYTQGKETNAYMTASRCKSTANKVHDFYDRNSRGKFNLIPAGYQMTYNGAAFADFSRAERVAKQKFNADYYVIPSLFRNGGNHASNDIAHVSQLTSWVINHEVGHLLGLGHSGAFTYDKKGNPTYNPYGDRDSVMGGGGTGSRYLSIPHYYVKGWLNDDEVALYDSNITTYEIKAVDHLKDTGLATVVIPPSMIRGGIDSRHVFLGYSQACGDTPCVDIYLSENGSSRRVKVTKDELYEKVFTDLHIKILPGSPMGKVRFSVDFQAEPTAVPVPAPTKSPRK